MNHIVFHEACTPVTPVLRPHFFGEARSRASLLVPASARPALRLHWCCGRISSARPALGRFEHPSFGEAGTPATLVLRSHLFGEAHSREIGTSQLRRGRHSGYTGVAAASLRRGPLSENSIIPVSARPALRLDWCCGRISSTRPALGERDHPSFGEAGTPVTLVLRPHLFGEVRSREIRSSQLRRGRHSGYTGVAAASLRRGPLSASSPISSSSRQAPRSRWCRGHAGVAVTLVSECLFFGGGRRDTPIARLS